MNKGAVINRDALISAPEAQIAEDDLIIEAYKVEREGGPSLTIYHQPGESSRRDFEDRIGDAKAYIGGTIVHKLHPPHFM